MSIHHDDNVNRAFLYGDALFETILVKNGNPIFLEEHYFRLLSGMRQLKMEIPHDFNVKNFNDILQKYINTSKEHLLRLRITVFRKSAGFYLPSSNEIGYNIDIKPINVVENIDYKIGIYTDNYLTTNSIDNIKTINRLINVMANIYAKEHQYDNVVLLNHKKQVVSVSNGNLFLIKDNNIYTPPLSEGCIDGIIRRKIIELIAKTLNLTIYQTAIETYHLQNANEIFITNSILGIQPVYQLKNKRLTTEKTILLKEKYENLIN